jgi:hypothetical protein
MSVASVVKKIQDHLIGKKPRPWRVARAASDAHEEWQVERREPGGQILIYAYAPSQAEAAVLCTRANRTRTPPAAPAPAPVVAAAASNGNGSLEEDEDDAGDEDDEDEVDEELVSPAASAKG